MEIVTDGASAIYGSDAVGGVANIILRPDFEGIETDARLGKATDGGDFQQQYDIVTGRKWGSGGFIVTYDFQRNTAINADQRSYTRNLDASTTLVPYFKQHSALLSGHQIIGPNVEFSLDGTFGHRDSRFAFARQTTASYEQGGQLKTPSVTSFSVAPRIAWHAPKGWLISLDGLYGWDRTRYSTSIFNNGALLETIPGHYTNRTKSVELNAEGKAIDLPAGPLRLAFGVGYRSVALSNLTSIILGSQSFVAGQFHGSRRSYYGFGELLVPVVSPEMGLPGVRRLEASAAIRYESYADIGHVATPKIGAVYEPVEGLSLHGTWGRSFKTPELYQQFTGFEATLYSAVDLGAPSTPANATALYLDGGNPNLGPERASTWTGGITLQPAFMSSLRLDATYFHIDYRNRIVSVDAPISGLLNNPLYDQLIDRQPTAGEVSDLVSKSAGGLYNQTSSDFDPENVIAVIDGRFVNVARQTLHGIDLSADYRTAVGAATLHVTGSASYLASSQKLLASSPSLPLAGTIYNPSHWRGRVGAIWQTNAFSLSSYINYAGPVTDNEIAPSVTIGSLTTIDLAARLAPDFNGPLLKGLSVLLSVQNLLNGKPAHVPVSTPADPAYDSTNYSAIGRLVSITISKRW